LGFRARVRAGVRVRVRVRVRDHVLTVAELGLFHRLRQRRTLRAQGGATSEIATLILGLPSLEPLALEPGGLGQTEGGGSCAVGSCAVGQCAVGSGSGGASN
jgi:hypothetical protein